MSDPLLLSPLSRSALFLDFDGTLAPIAETPGAVSVDGRMRDLLGRLSEALDGRLAIVSGRPVAEIEHLTGSVGLSVAGVHGLERRTAGGLLISSPADPDVDRAAAVIRAFAAAHAGLIVEYKGSSIALHYRRAPQAEAAVLELAEDLARSTRLRLQPGRMVVELRSAGPDKGDAVRAFMAEAPFIGTLPVFFGDDLTDEPAFEAVNDLGGFSVQVGRQHDTAARYRLSDQSLVAIWLQGALARRAFSPVGLHATGSRGVEKFQGR